MKHSITICLGVFTFLAVPVVRAEGANAPAANNDATPEQLKRVQEFLQSPRAEQRTGTYKACRARGDAFKATYFDLLERAYKFHGNELAKVIRTSVGPGTPQAEAVENWRTWESLAPPAAEFVLTNHAKDKAKHHQMDKMFTEVNQAWLRVEGACKRLDKTSAQTTQRIDSALAALREIHREKAWCRPDEFDADEDLDIADVEKDLSLGKDVTTYLAAHSAMRAAVDGLAKAHAFNDALKWAGPNHKEFARILNNRRAALGLPPLRLEEKLSDACAGHSKEMADMGYFAHDSPVEENKTFVMRASKAGFTGHPRGECIFSGKSEPAQAESAWWYSDGHRLINYAREPNTLGLGPVGITWTLNIANLP